MKRKRIRNSICLFKKNFVCANQTTFNSFLPRTFFNNYTLDDVCMKYLHANKVMFTVYALDAERPGLFYYYFNDLRDHDILKSTS